MHEVVFLLDVDNTLLDNDRVAVDLQRHLQREVGAEREQRYWAIFEQLREELGYADYLGALQRYRIEYPRDPHLLTVSSFLVNYPFANRLFPNSLDVIDTVKQWGPAVILSDGDVVFQPRKVERSGLFDAVEKTCLLVDNSSESVDRVHSAPGEERPSSLGNPKSVSPPSKCATYRLLTHSVWPDTAVRHHPTHVPCECKSTLHRF